MEKDKIKELIVEHKERFLKKCDLIRREIQAKLAPFLHQKEIVVITGIRRSGKSSLLKLLWDDINSRLSISVSNLLYLNFEDERFVDFSYKDFDLLYETFLEIENPKGKKYFFLDEIQNIEKWERWINRIYEFEDVKVFITGSNATLLSSEISTSLTGRHREITIYPFSFSEFLKFKKVSFNERDIYLRERRIDIKNLFREYFQLGGFPEIVKNKDNSILEQYFKDIIYRDIISRYSIRNIKEIKELCLFIASNIGTIASYKRLKDMMSAKSINTIKNYLEILETVFLFFRVNLFDYSIKRQIYNPSKIYSIDHALSNSIAFKFFENKSRIYENILFIELKRNDMEIFYWKSKNNGNEVDFVIKKGLKIEKAIQVCYSINEPKTLERELKGLYQIKEELNVKDLTIITDDEEKTIDFNKLKIKVIPLWKLLVIQK